MDDDEYGPIGNDWTIRRVRRMPGGTIIVTERNVRPRHSAVLA